ncbi:MAG: hypothetical protein C0485_04315 [Pirellula sp.]|nr:hypothetical protein [Pirellula sp.]
MIPPVAALHGPLVASLPGSHVRSRRRTDGRQRRAGGLSRRPSTSSAFDHLRHRSGDSIELRQRLQRLATSAVPSLNEFLDVAAKKLALELINPQRLNDPPLEGSNSKQKFLSDAHD